MTNKWIVPVSSALVPGIGQVLLGRLWTGVALALAWLISAGCSLTVLLIWPALLPIAAEIAIAVVAVAIYAFSQIQVAGILRAQASGEVQQETDRLYKQACVEYLSSRFPEARKNLQALLAIDPDDADAHKLMSRLALAEGESQNALRWLKRAHFLDTEGKWDLEFRRTWAAISATTQALKTPPSKNPTQSLVSQ